jgi:hypothetical protein
LIPWVEIRFGKMKINWNSLSFKLRESIFHVISSCSALPSSTSDLDDEEEEEDEMFEEYATSVTRYLLDKKGLLYLLNGFSLMKGSLEWNHFPSTVKQVLIIAMEEFKDQYSIDEIPMLLRS